MNLTRISHTFKANNSYTRRMEAVARGDVPGNNVTAGLIYGSPEHDRFVFSKYFQKYYATNNLLIYFPAAKHPTFTITTMR